MARQHTSMPKHEEPPNQGLDLTIPSAAQSVVPPLCLLMGLAAQAHVGRADATSRNVSCSDRGISHDATQLHKRPSTALVPSRATGLRRTSGALFHLKWCPCFHSGRWGMRRECHGEDRFSLRHFGGLVRAHHAARRPTLDEDSRRHLGVGAHRTGGASAGGGATELGTGRGT